MTSNERFGSVETRKLFAQSTPKFGKVTVARYEFGKKNCLTLKINQNTFLKQSTLKRQARALMQVRIQGGGDWGDAPLKTFESNFIHHDILQFEEQHLRYKTILPSIVLSQNCCEVYFIPPTVTKPL